jgi:hypothetical protein
MHSLVVFDDVHIRSSEETKRVLMANLDTRLQGNIKSRSNG